MLDIISGLLVDLSLLGGVILCIMSFFNRYKQYRFKLLIMGLILLTVGIVFVDTAALSAAFQKGAEAARGM
jgi:uncharacterized membrane protein HdeD (DUF308 family)